jgi:hypothetical protein
VYFSADAVHFHERDGTADRAIYRVDLPHLPYDGSVRVTRPRHATDGVEQWIADRLDAIAARLGYDVLCGRLYSQVDLRD